MNFTDRRRKVMSHAWRCFDVVSKVNCETLAALAGFANAASANAFWHKIKVKLVPTPASGGRWGITSRPNGIASKQRGRLKVSKCTSKKPPKLEDAAFSTKPKIEAEEARSPMQSIPLESDSPNDRSGIFNHRDQPEAPATITSVSLPNNTN
ncbi:hypothetical protein DOTSEDRAFT_22805 [Dothistroma septosporum NZE10]|uniref:Uncharacterized protein n=1 Tax=Dothistroma septosporum (strain NZE10 / CBS 128990) TaxID=675120 RepID=N1PWK2_DOTSN|nr:hypothetical protein DOTSEDRAFT_22805 [Dothistroma septosporum NZE10]